MRTSIYVVAAVAAAVAGSATTIGLAEAEITSTTGTIAGTVKFDGKPPPRKPLDRASDPVCAKTKALDEAVVVTDGGVESAFVKLDGKFATTAVPNVPVVIDQKNCTYVPRVSGVVRGQTLRVRNSDGTMHNVHAYMDGATEFNLAQPKGARPIERTFDVADVLELKCDVHRWMVGYAVIVDHPYFAVTGKAGAFAIRNVPPGRHDVQIWHPVLGKRTATVDVKAGKTATVTATY